MGTRMELPAADQKHPLGIKTLPPTLTIPNKINQFSAECGQVSPAATIACQLSPSQLLPPTAAPATLASTLSSEHPTSHLTPSCPPQASPSLGLLPSGDSPATLPNLGPGAGPPGSSQRPGGLLGVTSVKTTWAEGGQVASGLTWHVAPNPCPVLDGTLLYCPPSL